MKITVNHKILIFCSLCFFELLSISAQTTKSLNTYSFVDQSKNIIQQSDWLKPFFVKLKETDKQRVNIVHIGDSHLQANFITNTLREDFQDKFGNAGRGLVFPYQVGNTNAPFDLRSNSPYSWDMKRVVHPNKPQPIGISGLTVYSSQKHNQFTITVPDKWAFDEAQIFYQNDDNLMVNVKNANILVFDTIYKNQNFYNFSQKTKEIEIDFDKKFDTNEAYYFFGVNTFKKENSGVLYHSIGANGAQFVHYSQAKYFAEEIKELHPDLIIISLGTNESLMNDYTDERFYTQVDELVSKLKNDNPNSTILLTTPAEGYMYKKAIVNKNLSRISKVLKTYCQEHQLAYWDLYEVTGSAWNWKKNKMFRPDGVHFEKEGYILQGQLLFEALMKAYEQYIP